MNRPQILDTAKSHVTKDRQATHGKPEDSFPLIANFWTVYLKGRGLLDSRRPGEEQRHLSAADVAQLMVLLKVARSIANPANEDNYIDQAGYTACAGELATLQNGPNSKSVIATHHAERAYVLAQELLPIEGKMLPAERLILQDAIARPTTLTTVEYNALIEIYNTYLPHRAQ